MSTIELIYKYLSSDDEGPAAELGEVLVLAGFWSFGDELAEFSTLISFAESAFLIFGSDVVAVAIVLKKSEAAACEACGVTDFDGADNFFLTEA